MKNTDKTRPDPAVPPIRHPVIFYATAVVAFGFLGAAVLALLL